MISKDQKENDQFEFKHRRLQGKSKMRHMEIAPRKPAIIRRLVGTITVCMFKVSSYQNVCDALSYLLDNIYIRIGAKIYGLLVFQRMPSLFARCCLIGRQII